MSDGEDDYDMADDSTQYGCQFGNIMVNVKEGDITMENTDCIVNSSNDNLDLSRGAVSQTLLRKGGAKLKQEAEKKKRDMKKNGLAITSAPGLPSKTIIHVVAQESITALKHIVDKCLEMAEKKQMKSIAFPALGTSLQMEPAEIAKAMVSAIMDFQNSPSVHLTEVRFVIYQSQMMEEFQKAIQRATGSYSMTGFLGNMWKGLKGAFRSRPDEPEGRPVRNKPKRRKSLDLNEVTFTIYAMEESIILKAITQLDGVLEKMVYSKTFSDTVISRLNDNQQMEIKAIARKHHVHLQWNKEGAIEVQGMMKKVIDAQDQIYSIIRDADKFENETSEAEIMSSIVQWHFIEITDVGQELMGYDPTLNLRIEKAYKKQEKSYEFQDKNGVGYVVDFSGMVEYTKDAPSDQVTVIRRDKIKEASFEAPPLWGDMKGNLKIVTLQTTDQEYTDIAAKFAQSAGGSFTVSKIDRIQNKTLFQQYQAKKKLLDSQNPAGTQNERFLWHGTAADSKDSSNAHGFNRSYCGKNATAFGDGVYFAVQASYSCQPQYSRPDASGIKPTVYGDGVYFAVQASYSCGNTYSKPDSKGIKRVYYCRVLTGEYTVGSGGMRVPPPKQSGGSHALYDSVVDNVQAPGMFIIFHDTQGYPDYLLEFK